MTRARVLALALVLTAASLEGRAVAQDAPVPRGDGFLAESGFDFWASDEAQRATASLRWYPTPSRAWQWQFGGRLGGERLDLGATEPTAVTLGAFAGLSHAVGRIWPTVTVGVDRPFRGLEDIDLETTATAGARWFLTRRGSASYALHVGAFRSEWSGSGSQPDLAGYGIFAGLHQGRLSDAAWRRLGPEGSSRGRGAMGREIEVQAAGVPGDFWTGFAVDSFFSGGRADVGIGFQRLCVDDPTNDLTACGWAGEVRGEWHFLAHREPDTDTFAPTFVPLVGLSAGPVAGAPHDYYAWEASAWAGVRWQPSAWPMSVHLGAVGRQLVARDGFEDRTVGGIQLGLSFR